MFPWCFCRISPWTFSLLIATRQWHCEIWRLVSFVRPKFSYSGRAEATFGMPSTITPPAATTFAECRTTTRKGSVFGFRIVFLPCILCYLVLSCAIPSFLKLISCICQFQLAWCLVFLIAIRGHRFRQCVQDATCGITGPMSVEQCCGSKGCMGPSTGQDRKWTIMDIHAKLYCKQRHESHRT